MNYWSMERLWAAAVWLAFSLPNWSALRHGRGLRLLWPGSSSPEGATGGQLLSACGRLREYFRVYIDFLDVVLAPVDCP